MKPEDPTAAFSRKIGAQETRKLKARQRAAQSTWFGFRMFGIVGWSVAIPALIGALLGHWLDGKYPGKQSWTLTLLVAGLVLGCANAWHWVAREYRAIHEESEDEHE